MVEDQISKKGDSKFPSRKQVVIIGGGVIGCSVAYHLTKLGWVDVVLLERKQLTSGTTWHAAGLVEAGGFYSETTIEMAKYTLDLYRDLECETGQSTGYKPVGMLEFACSLSRLEGLRRVADFDRGFGVFIEELTPSDIKERWPLLKTDDILAGFLSACDGRVNPVDVTMALAKGARNGGAQIIEDVAVTGIEVENGRVVGVTTDNGEIEAEYVVNCAGMWSREIGKMAGVNVPLQAAEHYYLITEPIDGVESDLPVLVDSDRYAYYREETGGIMLGLFEPVAAPWGLGGIPKEFSFGEINPDLDRMMPYIEEAMERIPIMRGAGIHKIFCGPESFTPDLDPLMGEAPELKNFYVAAGFNSLGILLGGGAGRVMAKWIVDGVPDVDVSEINIERMLPHMNNPKFLKDRTVEMLGLMFKESWPNRHYETVRNVRKSILHDRLVEAGAFFGESVGWEYPDWFAPQGIEPEVKYSWGRQNWFEYNAAEHKACRQAVVLMDLSLISKFLVQGRDSEKVLNRICANNVAVPVGKIVYTQWCNERGMLEADLTVTRLDEDRYLVACSDVEHVHVETWLKGHIPSDAHVYVTDVTSAYAMINVQGPKSRQLISRLTQTDMSNQAFPYLTAQEIDLHYARALAYRITYLGELGWELYIPTEFAPTVFDALVEAGEDLGVKHAGLQALNTLRMEKAYRDYPNDIDNMDNPLEAGLGFFVDFDKPGGFVGREALLRVKQAGVLKYRLLQFLLDDPEPLLHYGEPIICNGKWVGYIRSGAYGFTLGASVGLGFVEYEGGITRDFVNNSSFEIEVVGERYPAKASIRPMYDPKLERVRC